jgi:hypothetical protein
MARKKAAKKGGPRGKSLSPGSVKARQAKFLEAFVEVGTVHGAAKLVGIDNKTHYFWLQKDAEYAAAYAEAQRDAVDRLAAEAQRRAVEGVDEPVFYKGEVAGHIRRYSDTLLIFLLKARDPATYRDRIEHRHGNAEGEGPLQLRIVEEIVVASPEDDREADSITSGSA